eukprot:gene5699-28340_t
MTTTSRPMCSSALATRFLLVPFLFHGRFTSVNALAKCPDGGYALTPFLLLDPRREDATCILEQAFLNYQGEITLAGLPNLKDIGEQAFAGMGGTLTITGAYPELQSIQKRAFNLAGDSNSIIDFRNGQLNELAFVDPDAFGDVHRSGGTVHFSPGPYPKYKGCTLLSLKAGGVLLRGPNDLSLKGAFPNLQTIKANAFFSINAPNKDSEIDFTGGPLDELTSVDTRAFVFFFGQVKFPPTAEMPKYVGCTKIGGYGSDSSDSRVLHGPSSVPLTTALYEASVVDGTTTELNKATCIPNSEFDGYLKNVTIQGLPNLVDIGDSAFNNFGGAQAVSTLMFSGAFPMLKTIGVSAFQGNGRETTTEHEVAFAGLPSLISIGDNAFARHKVLMSGNYPKLEIIGAAFSQSLSSSIVTFSSGTESLKTIGRNAFNKYRGKLTIKGEFPNLFSIGDRAFYYAGTVDSDVDISCSSGPDMAVGSTAFTRFKDHAIPQLNTPASTTTKNHMYNIDMNQANAASAGEDFGSGDYATGPATSNAHSTLYAVPMEIEDPAAHDGGYIGVSGATGNTTTAARVKPGTVMYVSVINQDSPEYATAAANDSLYSVVSKPGRGGNGDGALPQGVLAQSTVYATAADAGDGADYDVAVHPQGGGPAGTAEYSHLALRNNAAGQQQQQNSNNHYDAGNPRAAQYAQSTVYATAATDQYAAGDAADYDVAVHPQGGGPASTAEYSHLALRNDAVGQQQQQNSNNHYDVSTPRAAREQNSSSSSNNHYDVDNPHRRRDVGSGIVSGDGDDYSTVA